MKSLSSFLDRFANILPHGQKIKDYVRSEIHARIGISIPESAISVTKTAIFINTHAIIKSEIALFASEMLPKIHKLSGGSDIDTIR